MSWPTDFDSFPDRSDGPGQWIYAAHINALQDAVEALQAELGLTPSAAYATVAEYLASLSSGLTAGLAGKAPIVHQHTASDVPSGVFSTLRLGTGTPTSSNFLRGDGTWAVPGGGGGGGGGSGAIFVASVEAPDSIKDRADFVCDGTNDQVEINNAFAASILTSAPGTPYGAVELSVGRFNMGGPAIIPGRGCTLFGQGIGSLLQVDAASAAAFDATGAQGTDKALVMMASSAEGQNAQNIIVTRLGLAGGVWNGSQFIARGIGGVILDQTNGGTTSGSSYSTYGWPVGPTGGDTYHRITDLYFWYVTHGVRFVGGGSTNSRGNNVSNCRGARVSVAGYSSNNASDCHFNQCHVIGSIADNAIGFLAGGGNTRLTGCKAAYFTNPGSWGFDIASTRCSVDDSEAQDSMNGVRVAGQDSRITGLRVETQESPCEIAVAINGNNSDVEGLYVHTRNSGTWVRGIQFDSTADDHLVTALVDPAGITTPVSIGTGANITDPANLPRGSYRIRVVGNPGTTLSK